MLLENHLPRIRKLIKEKLGKIPDKSIHNDDFMRNSFMRLYQALPRMIRMAINENIFIEFCMSNRERLLNIRWKDLLNLKLHEFADINYSCVGNYYFNFVIVILFQSVFTIVIIKK